MMAAALMTTACSSDDDSTSVTPNPAADQTVKSIPYTVTVGQGTTTRATVADDDVTLQFADGDKLYVEDNSGNVYGCLTLQSGAGEATGATFSGDLYYTGSEPADDLQLTATLVGASDQMANVSGNKVMGFENYPTTICATMAEAVQKYSKLTGSSTYGAKSFALSQQTAFLKFSITLSGTTAGSDVPVVIKNGSSTIGTGTVTATAGTSSVKADFVLALATGTTIAAGSKMNVGTKEIVYSSAGMTLSGGFYEYEEVPANKLLSDATAEDIGKVVGADGKIYANVAAAQAASTTACAIIAYVGSETGEASPYKHGLAIAMKDAAADNLEWKTSYGDIDNPYQYDGPASAIAAKESGSALSADRNSDTWPAFKAALANSITEDLANGISAAAPASGTSGWFLPSLYQWNKIVQGLSGQSDNLSDDPNNNYTASSLNTKITAAGGTGFQVYGSYWLSTEYDEYGELAWYFDAYYGSVAYIFKNSTSLVRSAFAF